MCLRLLAVCAIAFLAVPPVIAATLNGTAKDASGKPAAGVVITLRDAGGHQISQQTTDAQGLATFAGIPAGRYTVQSDGTTASPVTQTVEINDAPIVNVTL